jgi:hypothetical protein
LKASIVGKVGPDSPISTNKVVVDAVVVGVEVVGVVVGVVVAVVVDVLVGVVVGRVVVGVVVVGIVVAVVVVGVVVAAMVVDVRVDVVGVVVGVVEMVDDVSTVVVGSGGHCEPVMPLVTMGTPLMVDVTLAEHTSAILAADVSAGPQISRSKSTNKLPQMSCTSFILTDKPRDSKAS